MKYTRFPLPSVLFVSLSSMLLAFILVGCATRDSSVTYPSQIDVEVQSAPERLMDDETNRRSQILHNFLVGQFAYVHEDFPLALEHFQKTSNLLPEPSSQVHALLAELYLKERQLVRAKEEVEKALAQESSNVSYRLLYAGILESLNDLNNAEKQYRILLEQDKKLSEPYLLLAVLYGRRGKLDEGVKLISKYNKIIPNNKVGYELLGRFYELQEKLPQSESAFRKAIELGGLSEPLFTSQIRVLLRQNKTDKAQALAQRMLEQQPGHPIATRVLGELAISKGSVDRGLDYLRTAQASISEESSLEQNAASLRFRIALLELERQNYKAAERELLLLLAKNPEHHEARYYLASIYAGSNRRKDALELLEQVSEESPIFTRSKTFAAFLLRQEKQYAAAAANLHQVLEREPENLKARSYLALTLRDADKLSDAESILREGIVIHPQDERLLFQLSIVLHDLGKESESVQMMERVLEINDQNSDALNFVAYSLAEKDANLDRAESLIRKALAIRSQDSFYLDTLGWILYRKGSYSEAEEVLERAVSLSEDDLVILEHYGDILVKNGKKDRAREIYQRAMKAAPKDLSESQRDALNRVKEKYQELEP